MGRLYRGGGFSVCRHINYTGEILSFVGLALATGVWWALLNRPLVCPRRWPVFLCIVVFVVRVLCQMQWFWSRSIPWKEVVLEAGGIVPVSLASLAYGASMANWPLGALDLLAWLLFALGTYL